MQKKRLSLLFAAGAIAGLSTMVQVPEAKACVISQNVIDLTYSDRYLRKKTYCKAINNDIQITEDPGASRNRGIGEARVTTRAETGTCTFYLITRDGEFHRRFNLGDWETEVTSARANTYFGFRLGC